MDDQYSALRCVQYLINADGHTLECQFSDGTYCRVDLKTGIKGEMKRPDTKPFVSKSLAKRTKSMKVKDIQSAPKGNAIVIILAGYASNGDILLWELLNEIKRGRERGHWESVEIVRNNQAEPIECAFPEGKKTFISAYADGTILIRPFSNSTDRRIIATIPGIDAGVFLWRQLNCDEGLLKMLEGYPH